MLVERSGHQTRPFLFLFVLFCNERLMMIQPQSLFFAAVDHPPPREEKRIKGVNEAAGREWCALQDDLAVVVCWRIEKE
jgi:hypothetical protein